MSLKDATCRDSAPLTSTAAGPRRRRRAALLGIAVVGFLGLASTFTCTNDTIPAGQNGVSNGLCNYPRSCYLVNTSGANAGGCDDCSSASSCRLVFTPDNPGDYQSLSGTWKTATWKTAPTDWQAVCGLYPSPTPDKVAICAAPEMVCVARGVACTGYCVHHSAQAADGGTDDMGAPIACTLGAPIPPQRRPGASDGGTQTYCPLTDDVCCAGGGAAGGSDGGASDGGVAGDGGAAVDAAPADQSAVD